MAAKINFIIQENTGFISVRDQLYTIISTEIANQATLETNAVKKAFLQSLNVFQERFTPYGPDELPNINIVFGGGILGPSSRGTQKHNPEFFIDVHCEAATSVDDDSDVVTYGDTAASKMVHKVLNILRIIITFPEYQSLLLKPLVGHVDVTGFEMFQPQRNTDEANNLIAGRIKLEISLEEKTQANNNTDLIDGNDTVITPETTDGFNTVDDL